MNKFSYRLTMLRKKRSITQAELAREIGVSPSTIGNYELGQRNPRPAHLTALCRYFSVSSDFLLGIDDCPYDVSDLICKLKNQFCANQILSANGKILTQGEVSRLFDFLLISANVIISENGKLSL